MVTPKRRANIALALYVIALCAPAISLGGDWLFGFHALFFSFVGLFEFDLTRGYHLACFLGASANVLMVASYVGIMLWGGSEPGSTGRAVCRVTARSAAVLTLLVLGPLLYSGKLTGMIGYLLWVGAAAMLVSATWPAAASDDGLPAASRRKDQPGG